MSLPTRMFAACVAMLALMQGCTPAHTEVTSFLDPDFVRRPFRRILVAPRYEDLALRTQTEDAFARQLAVADTQCVPSMGILLPTREVKDEELFPLLAEKKIDAVLSIRVLDSYQEREFVPERIDVNSDYYLSARNFRVYPPRGGYGWGYSRTRVTRTGGYYLEYPRVRQELKLYDVATKRTAWFATTLTSGEADATDEQMLDSFAKETVARMMVDGVIDARVADESNQGDHNKPSDINHPPDDDRQ